MKKGPIDNWRFSSNLFQTCDNSIVTATSSVYVKRFPCLRQLSPFCDKDDARPIINWSLDFGGRSAIAEHLKTIPYYVGPRDNLVLEQVAKASYAASIETADSREVEDN
jgi:hypothetical protein